MDILVNWGWLGESEEPWSFNFFFSSSSESRKHVGGGAEEPSSVPLPTSRLQGKFAINKKSDPLLGASTTRRPFGMIFLLG